MRKSNELQIGKAGEYITCADLIMKGLIAYPSEQGLPYDVLIDTGEKLLKCQVKTTEKPRRVPQRNKDTYAYIFNVKRHGKNMTKRYSSNEVDVFALVELETKTVAYIENSKMPDTINIRVPRLKGTYYDEKGIRNYKVVKNLLESGLSKKDVSQKTGIAIATVYRMAKDEYNPFVTSAKYFDDFQRDKEWFNGI